MPMRPPSGLDMPLLQTTVLFYSDDSGRPATTENAS
jgi:hypothetical protein